ncbi:hypothetical protein SAMN05421766_103477 [Zobellia uliginosa]|uniref:Uncharacterized protein n=1 Tax=Zobellia uliginosa TaxID=143224 RepID=A0ABY1KVR6_9FLAO|nr:hypothetical protein SAMN05421766_103477 [Zobellia uliginosa]
MWIRDEKEGMSLLKPLNRQKPLPLPVRFGRRKMGNRA